MYKHVLHPVFKELCMHCFLQTGNGLYMALTSNICVLNKVMCSVADDLPLYEGQPR